MIRVGLGAGLMGWYAEFRVPELCEHHAIDLARLFDSDDRGGSLSS